MTEVSDIEYRPRIMCSTFAPLPGASGIASRLLERLSQQTLDYEIDVVCLRDEDQPHLERYAGCKIYRVSAPGHEFVNQIKVFRRAVSRLLEGGDYDLVHFTDPYAGTELINAVANYGFRTIFELTSLPSWELREIPWALSDNLPNRVIESIRRDERMCLKKADVVLTGTEITRKLMLSRGSRSETTFKLAGGGVLGQFIQDVQKADPPIIILIGRHAPWYDFSNLLDAVKLLKEKKYKFQLLIVGKEDDKITPKILKGIERRGLSEMVTLNAGVEFDEVPPLLQKASIGVIPLVANKRAIQGGVVPRKYYEYLAAALPIISTDTPAMREVSNNGENILLYKPGSSRELAKKLKILLDNENIRNEYAYKSLKMHKSLYHPDIGASILRRIYNALIKRKPITQEMFKVETQVFMPVHTEATDEPERFMDMPSFEELAQDDVTRDLIQHEKQVVVEDSDVTSPGVKPLANINSLDSEVTPITKHKKESELDTFDPEFTGPAVKKEKEETNELEDDAKADGYESQPDIDEGLKQVDIDELPQTDIGGDDVESGQPPDEDAASQSEIPEPTHVVDHSKVDKNDDDDILSRPAAQVVHKPEVKTSYLKPSHKVVVDEPKVIAEGAETIKPLTEEDTNVKKIFSETTEVTEPTGKPKLKTGGSPKVQFENDEITQEYHPEKETDD